MLNRQYIKSYQGSLKSYLYMLIYKYEWWKVENLFLLYKEVTYVLYNVSSGFSGHFLVTGN